MADPLPVLTAQSVEAGVPNAAVPAPNVTGVVPSVAAAQNAVAVLSVAAAPNAEVVLSVAAARNAEVVLSVAAARNAEVVLSVVAGQSALAARTAVLDAQGARTLAKARTVPVAHAAALYARAFGLVALKLPASADGAPHRLSDLAGRWDRFALDDPACQFCLGSQAESRHPEPMDWLDFALAAGLPAHLDYSRPVVSSACDLVVVSLPRNPEYD